ncbi:uncharacterized protein LOC130720430 [Lotus japonicus]|uniref:uncharacterized protein LOC130720430 n=1 Tax=Lotus japonicus TaxID=34305 RepID=UPI00258D406E|nr:uncharacterized protein LOC130720430 [Lotus japonicus]
MDPFMLRSLHSNERVFIKSLYVGVPYVFVPQRFDARFGRVINDTVELKDPVGNIFIVRYDHNPGDARLTNGIMELRSVHEIQTTLHIQFVYCGQSKFTINIYNLWPPEIDYKIRQQVNPQMNSSIVDVESSNTNETHDSDMHTVSDDQNYGHLLQYRGSDLMWLADITIKHIHGEEPMCTKTSFP